MKSSVGLVKNSNCESGLQMWTFWDLKKFLIFELRAPFMIRRWSILETQKNFQYWGLTRRLRCRTHKFFKLGKLSSKFSLLWGFERTFYYKATSSPKRGYQRNFRFWRYFRNSYSWDRFCYYRTTQLFPRWSSASQPRCFYSEQTDRKICDYSTKYVNWSWMRDSSISRYKNDTCKLNNHNMCTSILKGPTLSMQGINIQPT